MIELIVIGPGVLIFAICLIRMLRGIRNVSQLNSERTPLALPAETRRPSQDFHDQVWLPLCNNVAEAVATKCGMLTIAQRRIIWRARSPPVLEIAMKELATMPDAHEIARLLESLPTGLDRPDLTGWCERGTSP